MHTLYLQLTCSHSTGRCELLLYASQQTTHSSSSFFAAIGFLLTTEIFFPDSISAALSAAGWLKLISTQEIHFNFFFKTFPRRTEERAL
jgi:hypothetical protein